MDLGGDVLLAAKPAPDQGALDPDLLFLDPERGRHLLPVGIRDLRSNDDLKPSIGGDPPDRAFGLEKGVLGGGGLIFARDDDIAGQQGRVDIALVDEDVLQLVAMHVAAGRRGLVHQRRPREQGVDRVVDDREKLIRDVDQVGRGVSDGLGVGRDQRDRVADVSDLVMTCLLYTSRCV